VCAWLSLLLPACGRCCACSKTAWCLLLVCAHRHTQTHTHTHTHTLTHTAHDSPPAENSFIMTSAEAVPKLTYGETLNKAAKRALGTCTRRHTHTHPHTHTHTHTHTHKHVCTHTHIHTHTHTHNKHTLIHRLHD
jgi:hypothetical protein